MSVIKFKTVKLDNGDAKDVDFGVNVLHASVAIQSFDIAYSGSSDHHIHDIKAKASMDEISDSTVTVSVTAIMENDSGNKAKGSVEVLVIAECDA